MNRLQWWQLSLLLVLGTAQMAADVFGWNQLKGLAAATQVSPAMRVFTAHQGYETHAARFSLHWQGADGSQQNLLLTPSSYQGVRGPYNRRNVYGAALAYGPLLRSEPGLQAMQESVLQYAFCRPGTLRSELALPDDISVLRVQVRPVRSDARTDLPLSWEVRCGH